MKKGITINLVFRKALPEDSIAIKQLLKDTWLHTYADIIPLNIIEAITTQWHDAEIIKMQTTDPRFINWVCVCDDKMAGVIKLQVLPNEKYYLSQLYVHPDFQKLYIGSRLLNDFMEQYSPAAIKLSVEEENTNAIKFSLSKGFVITDKRIEEIEGFGLKTVEMIRQK
jgi:ribosomal protein S18 acetylase RimI-like enzyme